jgi:uncharacterized membrane protein YgcG
MSSFVKNLDTPLLKLSPVDFYTCRDAFAGTHIFGGIGSGKTTGSGKMLAGAFLRAGFGGYVTCSKPEEIPLWQNLAKKHNRSSSLVLLNEDEGFNFLTYQLALHGIDGIGTVVECLMRVLEAAKRASATATQKGGEAFWEESMRMTLRYAVPVLYCASGEVSISDLIRFISTAPQSLSEAVDANWKRTSFMYEVMNAAVSKPVVLMDESALGECISYWSNRFPAIPDKTRGNIVVTIAATLDRFLHGRLQKVFCRRTTIVPELSFHGAIILGAMPTQTWNEDGIIGQQLFKFLWQRAVLARNSLAEKHRERPVFLWSDEAQETCASSDAEFLSLCRSSKCAVCYLTQSLPTYYSKIGSDNPRDAAASLVGKFMTHVYHSNSCPETNEFASRMIGRVMTRRNNYSAGNSKSINCGMNSGQSENSGSSSTFSSSHSSSSGPQAGNSSSGGGRSFGSSGGSGSNWGANRGRGTSRSESAGYSESMENAIEPGDFARSLKTGGRSNGNIVTGVWFQGGRTFKSTGTNYLLGRFAQ